MNDPTIEQQSPQQGTTNGQQTTLPEDLQRRVNEATAAKAEADARTAEAQARGAEIKADSDATAARLTELKSLVPDISSAKPSTIEVKDATPMGGTLLTYAALEKVGARIAEHLVTALPASGGSVLVTADADLVTSDAIYNEVTTGLTQLDQGAGALIEKLKGREEEFIAPVLVGELLAAALPGILSLFSTERTLSTAATAASDLAAAAAVAGALVSKRRDEGTQEETVTIAHDGFRLLPKGAVFDQLTEVESKRTQLSVFQLKLSDDKDSVDEQLAELKAAKTPNKDKIAELTRKSKNDAARLDAIKIVLTAIDTFIGSLRAIPQGATRSPLVTAALHEQLHAETPFGYVLLVKAEAGQSQQEVTHHRFVWWEDKFSTVADVSVTYMLIDTTQSSILRAGTVTGVATAHGSLGDEPTIDEPIISN